MSKFKEYLEAQIFKFPKQKSSESTEPKKLTDEEFQDYVDEFFALFNKYKLKGNDKLSQVFLNEMYSLNVKKKEH